MYTSWTKLLTVLTLCSATTLGACAMDDANTGDESDAISDDAVNTTMITDKLTGEDQLLIAMPDGITVNLSVRQWQVDMNAWMGGFLRCRPSLAVDGSFGARTTTATKCFQRTNGLTQDGIVGPRTLGAMCADLTTLGRTDLRTASHCN
jgi:peptidoglycan hydrolase-like protein with peptidoglycan-binding domain